MFIVCIICTEAINSDQDVAVTTCGHSFHNSCIRNWFNTSRTCATCRQPSGTSSLIKVFFESSDETKVGDLHNDLLTANSKLANELDDLKELNRLQNEELRDTRSKLKTANEDLKGLERAKQCDDMALAGYRAIKEESEKEIVRLNEQVSSIALDLLAEKQLRRLHQTTLSKLEPDNPDYDILKILNDESIAQRPTLNDDKNRHYSITPFWQLNCEATKAGAIPKETSKEKNKPYVIPSKIQKGDIKAQLRAFPAIPQIKKYPYKSPTPPRGDLGEVNRPKTSSMEAFTMALTPFPQFQFGTNKPSVPPQSQNLFKFGDGHAESGAFRNESSNSQNGFQLLLSSSPASSNSPKNNFLANTNRYREQIASPAADSPTTVSSSSSKKFSFAQKISDR